MAYTTDDLMDSIKKRGMIPTSQRTVQQADFNRFMDEEQTNALVPMIMKVRENYFLKSYDQSITAGGTQYLIHPRAIGMKFQNVYFIPAAGGSPVRLIQVSVEELPELEDSNRTSTEPEYFYFSDNYFIIGPAPASASGTLRQWYYQRRNTLVTKAECGQITAINTGTQTVTVNSLPTAFTTAVLYDVIKGTPGFQSYAIDQTCTVIAGSDMTFASLPTALAVGDYIALAGESCIPQIIPEGFPILSQRTLIRCLRALNDIAGAESAIKDLKEMEASFLTQIAVRAEEQTKKIVSPNNISNWTLSSNRGW